LHPFDTSSALRRLLTDAQDATDGSKYQWDNLVDLLDSKNGTTEIWQLVQSAGLVDTLDGEHSATPEPHMISHAAAHGGTKHAPLL
jgi:hypothetical protein